MACINWPRHQNFVHWALSLACAMYSGGSCRVLRILHNPSIANTKWTNHAFTHIHLTRSSRHWICYRWSLLYLQVLALSRPQVTCTVDRPFQPWSCGRTTPQATRGIRQTHCLLFMMANRHGIRVWYYSLRMYHISSARITFPPIPWGHLICYTGGAWRAKMDTNSFGCHRQPRLMVLSVIWNGVQRRSWRRNWSSNCSCLIKTIYHQGEPNANGWSTTWLCQSSPHHKKRGM